MLMTARIESDVVQSAAQHFGLEFFQVGDDWETAKMAFIQRIGGRRPIIFAANLVNNEVQADDFIAIDQLSEFFPMFLHIDASRIFDYVTTLSEPARQRLALSKLSLCHPYLDVDGSDIRVKQDNTIRAATIVAVGMNCTYPPPTVILKPRNLVSSVFRHVEYVKGIDRTLAGFRDALGPLLVYLQEARFGLKGIREINHKCELNQRTLREMLIEHDILVETPSASLDLIVRPRN